MYINDLLFLLKNDTDLLLIDDIEWVYTGSVDSVPDWIRDKNPLVKTMQLLDNFQLCVQFDTVYNMNYEVSNVYSMV